MARLAKYLTLAIAFLSIATRAYSFPDQYKASIAITGAPVAIAVSPADRWIFVASSESVYFIDTLQWAEAGSATLADQIVEIAVSPDGSYLYVTDITGYLTQINLSPLATYQLGDSLSFTSHRCLIDSGNQPLGSLAIGPISPYDILIGVPDNSGAPAVEIFSQANISLNCNPSYTISTGGVPKGISAGIMPSSTANSLWHIALDYTAVNPDALGILPSTAPSAISQKSALSGTDFSYALGDVAVDEAGGTVFIAASQASSMSEYLFWQHGTATADWAQMGQIALFGEPRNVSIAVSKTDQGQANESEYVFVAGTDGTLGELDFYRADTLVAATTVVTLAGNSISDLSVSSPVDGYVYLSGEAYGAGEVLIVTENPWFSNLTFSPSPNDGYSNTNVSFSTDVAGTLYVYNGGAIDQTGGTSIYSSAVAAGQNSFPVQPGQLNAGYNEILMFIDDGNGNVGRLGFALYLAMPTRAIAPLAISQWATPPTDTSCASGAICGPTVNGIATDADAGETLTCSTTSNSCTGVTFTYAGSSTTPVTCNLTVNASAAAPQTCNLRIQVEDNGLPAASIGATIAITIETNQAPTWATAPTNTTCADPTCGPTVNGILTDPNAGQTLTCVLGSSTCTGTGVVFTYAGSGTKPVSCSLTVDTTAAAPQTCNLRLTGADNGTPSLTVGTTIVVTVKGPTWDTVPVATSCGAGTTCGPAVNGVLTNPDAGLTLTCVLGSSTCTGTGVVFTYAGSGTKPVSCSLTVNATTAVPQTCNLRLTGADNGTPSLTVGTTIVVTIMSVPAPPVIEVDFGNTVLYVTIHTLNVSTIDHYVVFWSATQSDLDPDITSSAQSVTVSSFTPNSAVQVTLNGLTNGITYYVRARAVNTSDQLGRLSVVISAIPQQSLSLTGMRGEQGGCRMSYSGNNSPGGEFYMIMGLLFSFFIFRSLIKIRRNS